MTGTPSGNRRRNAAYDEEDDLTKDMDDPMPEPNIQEVSVPRIVNVKSHRDTDFQPARGSTLMDVDEEADVSNFNHSFVVANNILAAFKFSAEANTYHSYFLV